MVKYTIKQGTHLSTPHHSAYLFNPCISVEFLFNQNSAYKLPGSDSLDWNKLAGVKSDLKSPPTYSAMIAWRCIAGKMQVAPYINDNGIVQPVQAEILEVDFNTKNEGRILFLDNYVYISINNLILKKYRVREGVFNYTVQPYFGGNKTAPKTLSIYADIKWGE